MLDNDPATGAHSPAMAKRSYTPEQRAEALELHRRIGPRQAGAQLGIPAGTIAAWASQAGIPTDCLTNRLEAVEAAKLDLAQRKAMLASDLLDDIEVLRAQMFSPCVERKIVTLAGSKDTEGRWAVAEADHDEPTFADKRAIMTSIAIAVDKVQILTGAATERVEHRRVDALDDELRRLTEQLAGNDRSVELADGAG